MTTKIQELRAQYPGAYDDWTDKEIADGMYNKYYSDMDRRVYDQRIGILPSDSTPGFWDTVKAGADNLSAGFSAIEAGFGELIGDEEIQQKALEEYNRKRSNASDLLTNATDWRDVVNAEDLSEGTGKFLDYTKELFGLNSPQMATIMAGGIAGATAAPLLPNPVAAAVSKVGGFGVGAALTALPVFTGFNVSRQIDEGVELNLPKAAALAVPQAAFEAAFASVLVKSGLTKAGTSVFGKSPNVPKLVAGKVSEAVAIGVPAEVFQQALERTAANLTINPFESEEAATEYLDSAIGAAVLGGGFGAISGGVQAIGIPKAVPQKTKTELESIFKEDVIQSPPPRSTLIGTPDLASQVLKNQGFDVSKFPDDLKVKAANFVLDKVEQNRMGYREKLFGVRTPEGGLLRTSTGLTPVGSLKLKIENFEPITSPDLENVKSDADIKSLAEAISPQSPFVKSDFDPLDISFTPLKLDDTSLTLEQKTAARAKYRLKKSRPKTILGGPQDEATTTLSELPGQILEDVRVQEAKRKDLLKMRKPELIQKAKEVGVPDTEINDAVSNRQRTSAQIADAIMRKSYENPEILPQPRMKPLTDVVGGPLNRVSPSPEIDIDVKTRNGVTPKTPPKRARAKAQMTEIKKALVIEPDTKFNPVSVLDQYNNTLDPLSTAEQKPVEAVMEANLFSVASKVNNSSPFINLETQLLEVFRYFTDSGLVSQKDQKVLENAVPKIEKALRTHLGLPKGAFDYFLKTPEGKKELTASYFANFVEAKRLNKKFVGVPQEVSPIFNKLHRSLLKAHTKAKSLGNLNFPAIFDNDESSANDEIGRAHV